MDRLLTRLRKESGFTLIELLVVLAIIGILMAFVVPRIAALVDRAKERAVLADLRSMKTVVELHYAEGNSWPAADNGDADGTIKSVMNGSGIRWGDLPDPWGNPYWYRVGSGYIIFTTRDNVTYYFVTDRHGPTKGPFPEGYPTSGGVPSLLVPGQPEGGAGSEPEPPEEQPPSVVTQEATDVTATSATLNMAYDFKGYGSGQVQFGYKLSGGDYAYTSWVDKAGSGTYAETISGLASNTTYRFKARLKYDTTVLEGDELSFTTLRVAPTVTTIDARTVGPWRVRKKTADGTIQVEAGITYGDYRSVEISIRYRTSGDSWTYTAWETIASASYTGDISKKNWVAGETYYFEAVIRFASPYQYAYGGEKPVTIPPSP